ncbi:3-deoxy-manno-octulosonate cytidylyltransferase [Ferruginibacter albus]|uniref:3-deoxy-manno-octulosonate cytidylyltransferase n=1 Tax=Ferruginibacter albus TaxID=2875540 RepID=UPI001CC47432|nr:3-deoxy-manno-octulosonate cytidylyltransferase [Ferruginibacter albus]UAY51347.1 3-deoxy-manno-octulosonate cytidylyltransferase [Ferruginibacter albus]
MIVGIIPARYASTRFPGKPLADIKGKSMIRRVYEQASQSSLLKKIIVATDDERIYDHVKGFGGEVVMTAIHHPSGTDRCWDALQQLNENYQYIINIQGDEPIINPKQIDELATVLDGTVELATQMQKITDHKTLFNPDKARIVLNSNNEALYFTRSVIPYLKNVSEKEWHLHHNYYRHVGMYAYRTDVLEKITKLPVSSLEKAESLEQLRWLQNGYKIKCVETGFESYSIDTPDDLQQVLSLL